MSSIIVQCQVDSVDTGTFGPFETAEMADRWIAMRQKEIKHLNTTTTLSNKPDTTVYTITELRSPFEILDQELRAKLWWDVTSC